MRITGPVTALFLLLGVALAPSVALAQSNSQVFTVRGVEVDVTADGITAARRQALAQGQVRAMRDLLERLILPEDYGSIPPLSAAEVQDYVLDFGVADERTSAVRYIASMTVRFRPGAVRRLLRANGLRFAEVQSRPVLVVPVWSEGSGDRLWQGFNPWLSAWILESDVVELVPVLTPLGDLEDLRDIDAVQALAGDSTRLRTIGERYGADSVLVSHAVQEGDPDVGLGGVRVESRRYRQGNLDETFVESYSQQQGEDLPALLERAAAAIDRGLQEQWKRANVMSFDELQRILVEVPVAELSDWLLVRRRLEGLASVAANDLVSLTRQRALVELAFYGSIDQLLGQLEQRDLLLTRQRGGFGGESRSVVISGQGASGPLPGTHAVAAKPQPDWRLTTRGSPAAGPGVEVTPISPPASSETAPQTPPQTPPQTLPQPGGPAAAPARTPPPAPTVVQ
ncbi:DUF2066 domain-containing protein [Algihabitans albus]|uniref:DUF2066 domain-containing protein n=1 Tax=Algihabitans albus TaxID=2164067 RepID=UPI000E5D9AA2|nr:DUF2066 domain-containing protein [Algihabitans albus]